MWANDITCERKDRYQDLAALITDIYQGSLEKKPWTSFLSGLYRIADSDAATLLLQIPNCGSAPPLLLEHREQPSVAWDAYPAAHRALTTGNPLIATLAQSGGALTLDQVIERAALHKSEFYRQLMRPFGIEYMLGIAVESCGYRCVLSLLRGPDRGDFSHREKQLLLDLSPHLSQALKLHATLRDSEITKRLYGDLLESLTIGAVVLDGRGKIIECNSTAATMLDGRCGVTANEGRLIPERVAHREPFNRLVRRALEWREQKKPAIFAEALRIEHTRYPDTGVLIRTTPVTDDDWGESAASVIVYLDTFQQGRCASEDVVARLFGLTRSEARLASLLACGLTLVDAAEQLHLTESTARTYSKKIFSKMGINRQADLVRLIIKSAALMAPRRPEHI